MRRNLYLVAAATQDIELDSMHIRPGDILNLDILQRIAAEGDTYVEGTMFFCLDDALAHQDFIRSTL
jgi:hypothetical protein